MRPGTSRPLYSDIWRRVATHEFDAFSLEHLYITRVGVGQLHGAQVTRRVS